MLKLSLLLLAAAFVAGCSNKPMSASRIRTVDEAHLSEAPRGEDGAPAHRAYTPGGPAQRSAKEEF
jgi:hypothetical protein